MDAAIAQLQMQFRDYTLSLYQQGFLDDRFTQLKKCQDDENPDLVNEVLTLFFEDCVKLISNMDRALDKTNGTVDFSQVDASVFQLFGSSASVGAKRVNGLCGNFKKFCEAQNYDRCVRCMQQVDIEYKTLQTKLQEMFNLEKQIIQAGGTVPQVDIN